MLPQATPRKNGYAQTSPTITSDLIQLTEMVNDALIQSVKALVEHDEALARAVSLGDDALNQLRYRIEERCYASLEHVAPNDNARAVVGMGNVATNLERIGDYAARVASRTQELLHAGTVYTVPATIPMMAEVARELVEGSIEAYLADNDLLAERVVRREREPVELSEQPCQELGQANAGNLTEVLPLMWIAIQLERVGERAISICERAIYNTTGDLKEFR